MRTLALKPNHKRIAAFQALLDSYRFMLKSPGLA